MSAKKPLFKARRYALALIGVVAAVGGVAGNLGSIVDLYDKIFGGSSAESAEEAVPTVALEGTWQAEVTYDWGAKHAERFVFRQDGSRLGGTASFLGRPRGVLEGKVTGDQIRFVLKTQETAGSGPAREVTHLYEGKGNADEIRFVLQSTGGHTEHTPVEFVAKKVSGP